MKMVISIQSAGGEQKKEINLDENQEFIIGREGKDLALNDSQLSRQHCKLILQWGKYLVMDTGSRNGVFVNGEKVSTAVLKNNDLIQIGQTHIRIVELEAPAEAQPEITPEATPSASNETDPGFVPKPEGFGREESPKNFSLDQIEWKPNWFISIFKLMFTQPKAFFTGPYFDGDVKRSLLVILSTSAISGALSLLNTWNYAFGFVSPTQIFLQSAIFPIIVASIFCGVVHGTRRFTGAQGEFSNFLRFCAFATLPAVPVALVGIVSTALVALLSLASLIFFFWGFLLAFKPHTVKFIVVCILIFLLNGVVGKVIFMAPIFPSPLAMSDNPSIDINKMNEVMETMPERTNIMEKLQLGEPLAGQAMTYAANVQRGATITRVTVKGIIEGEGEKQTFKGTVESNGKQEAFDLPLNFDVALLMAAKRDQSQDPESNLFLVMNLLSMRTGIQLIAGLAIALPKESLTKLETEKVQIAGLDGFHIKNMNEFLKEKRKKNPEEQHPADLVVSKQAPFPLMIRGMDRRHKAGYAIQLRSMSN